MVGDTDADVAAGTAAGCARPDREPGKRAQAPQPGAPDATARDLATAAEAILGADVTGKVPGVLDQLS